MTGPKRILVVEDDPAIAQLLRLMLEDEGYGVAATRDPGEAIGAAPCPIWSCSTAGCREPTAGRSAGG